MYLYLLFCFIDFFKSLKLIYLSFILTISFLNLLYFFCLTLLGSKEKNILFDEDRGRPFIITKEFSYFNSDGSGPFSCGELKLENTDYKKNLKIINTFITNVSRDKYY